MPPETRGAYHFWLNQGLNLESPDHVFTLLTIFRFRSDIYSIYALSLRNNLLSEHEEGLAVKSDTIEKKYEGPCMEFGHVKVPETCVFYKSKLSYAFVNLRSVLPDQDN